MANNVRLPAFYRLDPLIGWKRSPNSVGVEVDAITQYLSLAQVNARVSPLVDVSGAFGGKTLPTGVAVGPGGVVVVANPDRGELLYAPHQGLYAEDCDTAPAFVPLWEAPKTADEADCALPATARERGPYDLAEPRGVAFSCDGDLLVTDSGDEATAGRMFVYTWPGLRVRAEVALGGQPWDIAVAGDGQIYIANAGLNTVQKLDRAWRKTAFATTEGALLRPKHLTIAEGGVVYVIDTDDDTGNGRLSKLDRHGRVTHLDKLAETAFWSVALPPAIQERDGAYFAPGQTCVDHGPQLLNLTLDRRGRLPQGPTLRYTVPPGRRARKGTFHTEALDSATFAFAWHRLVFDMDLGEIGAIEIQSFTSESFLEPERIGLLSETQWSRRIVLTPDMPPEALIQSAPGRYLWLRIGFVGDGVSSPVIRSIDIGQPRNSSLRFLPAPFHEDPEARDFLDRFLSYFDTIFEEIDTQVSDFSAHLGPRGAPEGAFLAWIASWFDIKFLARWDDATRRAFVTQAMDLHRARGTIIGLSMVLRLHLRVVAPMPVLLESFRLRDYAARRETGEPDLPDGSLRIGGRPLTQPMITGGDAHRFYVVAPASVIESDAAREELIELVDAFKPAHTAWELIDVEPGVRVGCQSTVGVDALVGGYAQAPLGEMQLGQSGQLTGSPNRLRRLGSDRIISRF